MDFVHLQREQNLCTRKTVSSLFLHVLSLKCIAVALTSLRAFPILSVENYDIENTKLSLLVSNK